MLSAELPETGLQMALTHRPDLILLDIQLPGHRRLRSAAAACAADAATRDIPVIAISTNALHAERRSGAAARAGFDDYLTKPIDVVKLLATLDDHLASSPLPG